jgi:REP element-mobilizing transposase RayT
MSRQFHGQHLRKGRVSIAGQAYSISTVTRNRSPVFTDLHAARSLIRVLREHQEMARAETLAFVVMPEHLHWLMCLSEGQDLSSVVRSVKAISSRRLGCAIWQKGFYDHAIRRDADLRAIARYIIANPLRAGLVVSIGEYPHWDAVWL